MDISLNEAQLAAVEHIYGPLLVLAGPGTGKTQLLSSRVAEILNKTDVSARNILCLTFTESGAQNMRERLIGLIGDAAYDVTISTYHSFGSDIIKNYSEYFQQIGLERSDDLRMERPVDELTQVQIIENIINKLPFDSPLLSARYYIKSVVSTISDLKQNLISPDKLREIAKSNLSDIEKAQKVIDEIVNDAGGISLKKVEKFAQYSALEDKLSELSGDLIDQAVRDLEEAHLKSDEIDSPTPLREWKDKWLHKDSNDRFTLTDPAKSEKMIELTKIYEKYEKKLKEQSAYDFDDMILRAIDGLKNNDELRFNLQERYQFILLDEFQDTNPSQFELVKRIADHPVHEGKPNVMAVGDDDQAIFAFQGANVGNMKDFVTTFSDVAVINLIENYRSHPDILHVAHNVSEQIENRLHSEFEGIEKLLKASSDKLPKDANIARHEFEAEASEYSWVASEIKRLIKTGTKPSDIAVLSPKHKILEGLVPFLKNADVALSYEKRENILETEIVQGLKLTAQLLDSLQKGNSKAASQFFPLVLSLPYWKISPLSIWKINWQYSKREETRSWAEIALQSKELQLPVTFYLSLSTTSVSQPLEVTLDKLIGSREVEINSEALLSPLKEYYFAKDNRSEDALKYYEAISHLSVIRSKLRDYQSNTENLLTIDDFLNFFTMYEAAESPLINSHPIAQSTDAVQLMTVYKAKGLEFENVFILNAHDDIWGSASMGGNNKLSLPANLTYIRYANSTDDERKRLLFVAITRAKHKLYITSHLAKDSGKKTIPLKYLRESDGISGVLPEKYQQIKTLQTDSAQLAEDTETLWLANQVSLPANFKSLLSDKIKSYQMSPTHINSFIDLENAGPEAFLIQTILRFPQAPSASGEYGTAIHNTLEWYQNQLNNKVFPKDIDLLNRYESELKRRYLSKEDYLHALDKGKASLVSYINARRAMFSEPAKTEVNFYSEGVIVKDARLSGKIDRLEIDENNKTIKIADYKTGKPLKKWGRDLKSIKYKQQLYFYKILLESSSTWKSYKVESARLEFVEPENKKTSDIAEPLFVDFNEVEELALKTLISNVWTIIQELNLPDVSKYSCDVRGTEAFIKNLSRT